MWNVRDLARIMLILPTTRLELAPLYEQGAMWLEPVRSIWVPTSSLMMLVAAASFVFAVVGGLGLLSTLIIAQVPGQAVVWLEGHWRFGTKDEEIRIDRTALWGSLGFQLVCTFGISVCYGLGWAWRLAPYRYSHQQRNQRDFLDLDSDLVSYF